MCVCVSVLVLYYFGRIISVLLYYYFYYIISVWEPLLKRIKKEKKGLN